MRAKGHVISIFLFMIGNIVLAHHLVAEEGAPTDYQIVSPLSHNIYAEILPRMELLAGVLSHTSWMELRGPRGAGNQYFQALHEFLLPYKEHEAMRIAESLTRKKFVYDAPPHFMLHLSPLPELRVQHEYSEYVSQRARGRANLEMFRVALQDLGEQSDFLAFFEQQRPLFERILHDTVNGFDATVLTNWMETFYGWSGHEFHIVLAPAMFPSGGYGVIVETNSGPLIYQVLRDMGTGDVPEFQTGSSLTNLTLHEFSHSFVNPSIRQYSSLIQQYALHDLFTPVEKMMNKQAYDTTRTFLNETVVRAVSSLAIYDLYGDDRRFQGLITYQEQRGFYLTRFTIEQLQYYQQHRALYARFDDFIPYLLQQYGTQKEHLLSELGQIIPNNPGYLGAELTVLSGRKGVVLKRVLSNSPADKAGLQPGDAILSVAGSPVESVEAVAGYVKETAPGTRVPFHIVREGKAQTIQVIIGQWQ
jgi:hypothetical protein